MIWVLLALPGQLNQAISTGIETVRTLHDVGVSMFGQHPVQIDWGPKRSTYTIDLPADHPVLNSITDSPAYGDERVFVQTKRSLDPNSQYSRVIKASIGDTVDVYVIVENDAADNIPPERSTIHKLTATLTYLSNGSTAQKDLGIKMTLNASNAAGVWTTAEIMLNRPGHLAYVPQSASYYSGATINPIPLADGGFGLGQPMLLGANAQDGELPVGNDNERHGEGGAGYLKFMMQITE